MPIKNVDQVAKAIESGKGRKKKERTGPEPDVDSPWARAVARGWFIDHLNDKLPAEKIKFLDSVRGYRFTPGDAGKCSRQLGFKSFGLERGAFDLTGRVRMWRGTVMHTEIEDYLQDMLPADAEVSFEVGVRTKDGFLAGFADAVIKWATGDVTVVETKTTSPSAYAGKLGAYGDQGPQYSHVAQGAIYAQCLGATELVVLYVAQSAMTGPQMSKLCRDEIDAWAASWTFDRETVGYIADRELSRMREVADLVDQGILPDPKFVDWGIPDEAVVTKVGANGGAWVHTPDGEDTPTDVGTNWGCKYCDWFQACRDIGIGSVVVVHASAKDGTPVDFVALGDGTEVTDGSPEEIMILGEPEPEGVIDENDPRLVPDWTPWLIAADDGEEEE